MGAVLASRRPRHPVGWLLLTVALSLTATAAAAQYLTWGPLVRPGALPAARWVSLYYSAIGFTAMTSIGLLRYQALGGPFDLRGHDGLLLVAKRQGSASRRPQ